MVDINLQIQDEMLAGTGVTPSAQPTTTQPTATTSPTEMPFSVDDISAQVAESLNIVSNAQAQAAQRQQQGSAIVAESQDLFAGLESQLANVTAAQVEQANIQEKIKVGAASKTKNVIANYNEQVTSPEAMKTLEDAQAQVTADRAKLQQAQTEYDNANMFMKMFKQVALDDARNSLNTSQTILNQIRQGRAQNTANVGAQIQATYASEAALNAPEMERAVKQARVAEVLMRNFQTKVSLNEQELQMIAAEAKLSQDVIKATQDKLSTMSAGQALTIQNIQGTMAQLQLDEMNKTIDAEFKTNEAVQPMLDDAFRTLGLTEFVGLKWDEIKKDPVLLGRVAPALQNVLTRNRSAEVILRKTYSGEAMDNNDREQLKVVQGLITDYNKMVIAKAQADMNAASIDQRAGIEQKMQADLIPSGIQPDQKEWKEHGWKVEDMYNQLQLSVGGADGAINQILKVQADAFPDQASYIVGNVESLQQQGILNVPKDVMDYMNSEEYRTHSLALNPAAPEKSVDGIVETALATFTQEMLADAAATDAKLMRMANAYAATYKVKLNSMQGSGKYTNLVQLGVNNVGATEIEPLGRRMNLASSGDWYNILKQRSIQRRAAMQKQRSTVGAGLLPRGGIMTLTNQGN